MLRYRPADTPRDAVYVNFAGRIFGTWIYAAGAAFLRDLFFVESYSQRRIKRRHFWDARLGRELKKKSLMINELLACRNNNEKNVKLLRTK